LWPGRSFPDGLVPESAAGESKGGTGAQRAGKGSEKAMKKGRVGEAIGSPLAWEEKKGL